MKPVKQGSSFGMWSDAVTGYFCVLEVYVGKSTDGTTTKTGLGEQRVML